MSSSIPMFLVMLLAHVGKRSNSRSQMFSKTGVLKNFAIFTGKNLCWSLFLIKFQDWRPAFLFKQRLQRRCFSVRVIFYYCKIRPRNRKNFVTDRSKFVFHYLIISCSSDCKEKLVALNWTILVSNFSSTVQKQSPGGVLLKRCS